MSEENFTKPKLFAGLIGAVVENKPLDEALKEVGLSEAYAFRQLVAPQSSAAAIDYVKEVMTEQWGKIPRDDSSELYVVKKVLCDPDEYEAMAEAVSGEDTDKFKVLRLIGFSLLLSEYKLENHGLEAYLVTGENPLEAMRKTTWTPPLLGGCKVSFDANDAKRIDRLLTDAIYNHTPEAVKVLFNAIGVQF